jgi:uncharacterized protein YcbK (DUF882 family)
MLHRRQLLKFGMGALGGAAVGAGLSAPLVAWGDVPMADATTRAAQSVSVPAAPAVVQNVATPIEFRRLALHNLHTDERIDAVYWENGQYVPDAVQAMNKVLRDHRSGEVYAMDRNLYDLLDSLAAKVETRQPFQVISGYRSAASNAKLSAASKGKQVADHSLHVKGQAMDIRVEGDNLRHLQKAALSLGKGGVGYYPVSNFVHVDTGRVRTWQGT